MSRSPLIFISAGDPSGDRNSSELVRSLQQQIPGVRLAGLGGPAMVRSGFESRFEFSRFNRMGYFEVLRELPFFLNAKKQFISMLADEKPDLLICVDYSGFNTPLMKAAKKMGIPVLWFIAPMIWAWKKYKHGPRVGQNASHVATIFPFEVNYWKEFTENVTYVGNPLLEEVQLRSRIERLPLADKKEIVIAFAPGSRRMEIQRILPVLIETATLLRQRHGTRFRFRVSCTEYLPTDLYEPALNANIELFHGSLTELFQTSDIALVTSGTTTLHAALTGIPQLVMYKSGLFLWLMVKVLTRASEFSHIGLPNIMSSDEVAKEFIQFELKPIKLVEEISKFIADPAYYSDRTKRSSALQDSFGGKAPSQELIPIIKSLISYQQ